MDKSFEDILLNGSEDELNELKRWLFSENVRLSITQKEVADNYDKLMKEKIKFQEEMNAINLRIVNERKRLKDEEAFFDKKMEILKNGFAELEADREKLKKEKLKYDSYRKNSASDIGVSASGSLFFAGVNNPLALKKRYRDLLKIYHPDNLCGDTTIVALINKEYEQLKKTIDYPFKFAK